MNARVILLLTLCLACVSAQAYEVKRTPEDRVIFNSVPCANIHDELESMQAWTSRIDKHTCQLPKVKTDGTNCSADITECLPEQVRKYVGKEVGYGPNCWNTALVFSRLTPALKLVNPGEFGLYMNSPLFNQCVDAIHCISMGEYLETLGKDPLKAGVNDLLAFKAHIDEVVCKTQELLMGTDPVTPEGRRNLTNLYESLVKYAIANSTSLTSSKTDNNRIFLLKMLQQQLSQFYYELPEAQKAHGPYLKAGVNRSLAEKLERTLDQLDWMPDHTNTYCYLSDSDELRCELFSNGNRIPYTPEENAAMREFIAEPNRPSEKTFREKLNFYPFGDVKRHNTTIRDWQERIENIRKKNRSDKTNSPTQ